MALHRDGHGLQLGEALHPALRLGGLARLGLEAVHEALQVGALGVLLRLGGHQVTGPLAPLLLEAVVVAGVEVDGAGVQMHDRVADAVEQLSVVADHQDGARIALQPRLQPQGALEVEVVGGLVQEEEVGLGQERPRQRRPHAPAAGEVVRGPLQVGGGEAEARQDLRGAGGGGFSADVDQLRVDFAEMHGVRGLQLRHQARAAGVVVEHRLQERQVGVPRLLLDGGDPALGQGQLARGGVHLPQDQLEQGGLAHAVAPHEPGARALGDRHRGVAQERAAIGLQGDFGKFEHLRGG